MIKIGITGQRGFIGTHLTNHLNHYPKQFQIVPFEDRYFENYSQLCDWVRQCRVIVHLAGVNRHTDAETLYRENLDLTQKLIDACEQTESKPYILFSSSIQEERNNHYGNAKREARCRLESWASKNNAQFSGLIIPNVFGPFGRPFYNSVVATFCYQLTHNQTPSIDSDNQLKLIYVGNLAKQIIQLIQTKCSENGKIISEPFAETKTIPHDATISVTELLKILQNYKHSYLDKGNIPSLENPFERDLFNTLVCYRELSTLKAIPLTLHNDSRGDYAEIVRFGSSGQVSFSTTNPGITRGNHYHTRKFERFAIIRGSARIQLRQIGTDKIHEIELHGNHPSYVDIPIWHTHNITNIGTDTLLTIFWINEHFNPDNSDTFFENV
ncbi:MAG TPA: NAD-dependent epimerase/dehydratase family protein [Salinivirgaceae bacterium]|mgnify:CR=1 FL=1|nr:NAD-dependent epimerase/dehydratase family protein [Salinivirgaceae bacterium]